MPTSFRRPHRQLAQELHRYTEADCVNYAMTAYAPLSFERPESINLIPEHEEITNPIEGRSACTSLRRMATAGWLEREGFAMTYAETQLHFGQLNLDDYRVLLISTHPILVARNVFKVKTWVHERADVCCTWRQRTQLRG